MQRPVPLLWQEIKPTWHRLSLTKHSWLLSTTLLSSRWLQIDSLTVCSNSFPTIENLSWPVSDYEDKTSSNFKNELCHQSSLWLRGLSVTAVGYYRHLLLPESLPWGLMVWLPPPTCKLSLAPFSMLATLTAIQHMPFHLPDFLAFVKCIDVSI